MPCIPRSAVEGTKSLHEINDDGSLSAAAERPQPIDFEGHRQNVLMIFEFTRVAQIDRENLSKSGRLSKAKLVSKCAKPATVRNRLLDALIGLDYASRGLSPLTEARSLSWESGSRCEPLSWNLSNCR